MTTYTNTELTKEARRLAKGRGRYLRWELRLVGCGTLRVVLAAYYRTKDGAEHLATVAL